jgi:hypothetical protein
MQEKNNGEQYFKTVDDMQHPDWVADRFVEALSKSVPLREALNDRIKVCLQDDQEARKQVKAILKEIDKEYTWSKFRKLWIFIGGAIGLAATSIIGRIIEQWIFGSN